MLGVEKKRFAIIGAGALGSYFGIRLAHAGNPVSFLLRSDFEPVSQRGMRLYLENGEEITIERPQVADQADSIGPVDIVIIGLKATRNYLYKELLPPVVGSGTILITIQNGLGNAESLQELFPQNPVMGALCQIGVNREGPGQIRSFVKGDGFVQLGGELPATQEQLEQVHALFTTAGIRTKITPSLGEALWRKLMWNVPFNGLTVEIGGKGTDAVCNDPVLRARARALMEEIRLAGNALGYPIEPEYTDKLLEFTDRLGAYMASSVLDWRAGRRIEVDAIFRKPLEAGTAAGVAMPELRNLVAVLNGRDERD